jgi:hypothetical protein
MSAEGKSFDDAGQNAITDASKTMRGITQFWVKVGPTSLSARGDGIYHDRELQSSVSAVAFIMIK